MIVVLVLSALALESWLECLAAFGSERFNEAWKSLQAAALIALLTWGVVRNPGKWGFRVGICGAIGLVLVLMVLALFLIGAVWRQEDPLLLALRDASAAEWLWAATKAAALGFFVVCALSLRRLYSEAPGKISEGRAGGAV